MDDTENPDKCWAEERWSYRYYVIAPLNSPYLWLYPVVKSRENCVFCTLRTLAIPRHCAPFLGEWMWHNHRNLRWKSCFFAWFLPHPPTSPPACAGQGTVTGWGCGLDQKWDMQARNLSAPGVCGWAKVGVQWEEGVWNAVMFKSSKRRLWAGANQADRGDRNAVESPKTWKAEKNELSPPCS